MVASCRFKLSGISQEAQPCHEKCLKKYETSIALRYVEQKLVLIGFSGVATGYLKKFVKLEHLFVFITVEFYSVCLP